MILDKIVEKKLETISKINFLTIDKYIELIEELPAPKSFYDAIKKEGLSIIGEIKKASPSRGVIKEEFNPLNIAMEYENSVDAISVLTEEDFFMGSLEYLRLVNSSVSIPILRKDFIIDERQIYESRLNGASAILLIAAILDVNTLKKFISTAKSIDLDPLVEAHTEEEVIKALEAGAYIIGINNRNLNDFSEDLNTTMRLRKLIPKDILVISESGISTKENIKFLKAIDGILVGESFMRCNDICKKAKEFKEAYEY